MSFIKRFFSWLRNIFFKKTEEEKPLVQPSENGKIIPHENGKIIPQKYFSNPLPNDVWFLILNYCDIKDLQRLLFVNKFFNQISKNEGVWKTKFKDQLRQGEFFASDALEKFESKDISNPNTTTLSFRTHALQIKYLDNFYKKAQHVFFTKTDSLKKAADLGHPLALLKLGIHYLDYDSFMKAMDYWEQAFQKCQLIPYC